MTPTDDPFCRCILTICTWSMIFASVLFLFGNASIKSFQPSKRVPYKLVAILDHRENLNTAFYQRGGEIALEVVMELLISDASVQLTMNRTTPYTSKNVSTVLPPDRCSVNYPIHIYFNDVSMIHPDYLLFWKLKCRDDDMDIWYYYGQINVLTHVNDRFFKYDEWVDVDRSIAY